ncbi:MAG: sigma 54-interacting transcriptional regulator [Myxococcota bacterium]
MRTLQTHESDDGAQLIRCLRIEVVEGPDAGVSLDADDRCVVGTGEGCTLRLSDAKVSRFHLELSHDDGIVRMEDLDSRNGTWVGDLRLERAQVAPGTRFRIGDSTLRVDDGDVQNVAGANEAIPGFVAEDPRSRQLAREIRKVAASEVSVLVRGETGTGKECVARALHDLSPRADQPFVVVDCGSIAPTLIASELLGHERGAFTGADRRRIGAFERANGGTVFLDEIGELPLSVQPALLGALERRRFRRVGGDQEIRVDVRVLSATHRDLRRSVNDGSFRADLYYRLAVARLRVPPLRKRPLDIPPLVELFVREHSGGHADELFGPSALRALQQHRFSGNVRELRNVVESALAVGEFRLDSTCQSLPDNPPGASPTASELDQGLAPYRDARATALDAFEKAYLERLVAECGKNASAAARLAQMDRNYLVSLLRKHGLR